MSRFVACLIAYASSLTAAAVTLPASATYADIPLVAWLAALVAGLSGYYQQKRQSRDDDTV